jgi:hypothetical protein
MTFLSRIKPLAWTSHAKSKMAFYKLSPMRVRRVLHSPKRVEEGVAPKTFAAMQPAQSHEIWVMFQDSVRERKIISAWRYPGVTKPRSPVLRSMLQQEFNEIEKAAGTRPRRRDGGE